MAGGGNRWQKSPALHCLLLGFSHQAGYVCNPKHLSSSGLLVKFVICNVMKMHEQSIALGSC